MGKYFQSLTGSGGEIERDFTIRSGATTVDDGALVMRGATPGTNGGMLIVGAPAYADAVGILLEELLGTATDSNIDGTTENRRKVLYDPFGIYLFEYSQAAANDVAVTSSSGTTITVGSLEDNIDGGGIYVVNSTNSNLQLRYLTASAGGRATQKAALGTNLTSADNIVKVLPRLHQLVDLVTSSVTILTAAAAGTGRLCVVENYVDDTGIAFKPLDPVGDSPRTLTANARLYSALTIQNSAFFPFD